jgi:hypothetical protein
MQFFFYEIVARIVGAYLAYDCGVQLYNGIVERKITYRLGRSSDWVDLLLDWSTRQSWVVERDTKPIRYWLVVASGVFTLIACLVVAIFGWFHSNT